MILHYYLNEKYVGTVDIETFLDVKRSKTLIYCTDECELLLGAMDLMYSKQIKRLSRGEAHDLRWRSASRPNSPSGLPADVFTTKKCGKVLVWSDASWELVCNL